MPLPGWLSWTFRDRPAPTGWYRFALVFVQVFATLFTAGVIIGYSQLYVIMTDSGVYHWKCPSDTAKEDICPEQTAALDSMFNIGASLSLFIQAPSGFVLTLLGPRVTCLMGLTLMIPGSFLFAFSSQSFDVFLPGFLLLAAGGPWVYISSMPCAGLFPKNEGIVLMVLNGAYGGGALVFLLMEIFYRYAGVSMSILFLVYGGCLVLGIVLPFIFWPWKAYILRDLKTEEITFSTETSEYDIQQNDETPMLEGPTLKSRFLKRTRNIIREMLTLPYLFLLLFVPFMVLKSNFMLSTLPQQIDHINDDDEDLTDTLNEVFGVMLPSVGLLAGPVGLIIDNWGISAGVLLVVILSSASSIIGILPVLYLQLVRFMLFALYFPLVYAVWGALLMLTFGFDNYGILYAFIAIVAGCVQLSSNTLVKLALRTDFLWINVAFLGAGLAFMIYPCYSWLKELITGVSEMKELKEVLPLLHPIDDPLSHSHLIRTQATILIRNPAKPEAFAELGQAALKAKMEDVKKKQASTSHVSNMLWVERKKVGYVAGHHGDGWGYNFRTRVGSQFQIDPSALPEPGVTTLTKRADVAGGRKGKGGGQIPMPSLSHPVGSDLRLAVAAGVPTALDIGPRVDTHAPSSAYGRTEMPSLPRACVSIMAALNPDRTHDDDASRAAWKQPTREELHSFIAQPTKKRYRDILGDDV